MPFRTSAYAAQRAPRFGPGTPVVGGGFGGPDDPSALGPDEAAELLRALAAGRGGPPQQ
jgi:hypothetical protein